MLIKLRYVTNHGSHHGMQVLVDDEVVVERGNAEGGLEPRRTLTAISHVLQAIRVAFEYETVEVTGAEDFCEEMGW